MSDMEFQSLVAIDSNVQIQMYGIGTPIPVEEKKELVHAPEVSGGGYTPLCPVSYELNNNTVVDPKTKKALKRKGTFTRYLFSPGQPKTEILSTSEVYFIPLEFKDARQYYDKPYDSSNPAAPTCQSDNGVVPLTNKMATDCGTCPLSKWNGDRPPACGELPTILGLDMTGSKVEDPNVKTQVTREAFTLKLGKSAIRAVKDLKKRLAEPVAFSDGTYGQIDMTRYIIKMTAETMYDDKGKETTYCNVIFEVVGLVPSDFSETLLMKLNEEVQGKGQSVLELFRGRQEPFTEVDTSKTEVEPTYVAPPTATTVATPVAPATIEVPATPVGLPVQSTVEDSVPAPAPAPEPVVELAVQPQPAPTQPVIAEPVLPAVEPAPQPAVVPAQPAPQPQAPIPAPSVPAATAEVFF